MNKYELFKQNCVDLKIDPEHILLKVDWVYHGKPVSWAEYVKDVESTMLELGNVLAYNETTVQPNMVDKTIDSWDTTKQPVILMDNRDNLGKLLN